MEGVTPKKLIELKNEGKKISFLTAYDYPTAKILDSSGIDGILVGDSVGNTVLGYKDTLPVTMEDMVHHTKPVSEAVDNALVVSDMPFGSYEGSVETAVENAGRLIKNGAEAVKLEGGREVMDRVRSILDSGVPVMGHLGFTPQKVLKFGSYKPRGTEAEEAVEILEDAIRLDEAGVFSIVLESIPSSLAKIITEKVNVPTIGIGAGEHCDGQILVVHDMLGVSNFKAKFVKRFADLQSSIEESVTDYMREVEDGEFPKDKHSYGMEEGEKKKLEELLREREI